MTEDDTGKKDQKEVCMNLFVFGLGYSALNFVTQHRGKFCSVHGTVRSQEKAEALSTQDLNVLCWNGDAYQDDVAEAIKDSDELVISIPPGKFGDTVLKHFGSAIIKAPLLRTIAYLSTVGVYGDHGGDWVSEETTPRPASERSRQRQLAEREWIALAQRKNINLHILRLAGIYGPGRNAIDNLRQGKARRIIKPGQVFNRIHVDDISSTINACLQRDTAEEISIWNVSDDEPCPPQDVVTYAASLMGVEPPPEVAFEDASLSPMGRSFYSEIKRVSNGKIKHDLGISLTFPTYREGLASLFKTYPDR